MKLTFKKIDDEIISAKLANCFPNANGLITVHPGRVVLPQKYAEIAETVLDLPIYSNDVWLVSYPRTGSTWAQEMIWLLGNKLDFEGAKQMQQMRSPLVELTALFSLDHYDWVVNSIGDSVELVKNMKRPRFARSHLPLQLLPKQFDEAKPKIIYTARNPKDLCVSFYHYCKLVHGLTGPLDAFCELFLSESTPIGSYWSHVLPFWQKRNEPNVLFLKYEDMNRNLPTIVQKCAKFLDLDYELTSNDLDKVCQHLKFDQMQANPAVNLQPIINNLYNGDVENTVVANQRTDNVQFIRKGKIGDWKNHLSAELSLKFDKWTEENTKGTGLYFDYE